MTTEQFRPTDNGLEVLAPAKINLFLLITGKRPDGFHGIETLMAKVDWYDELLFEPGNREGIELLCRGPHWAPDGPDNLVWRACAMLMEKAGRKIPLKVTLTKNIPAGTGLGSASSDAATALLGLNRFAGLNQPISVLHDIAAQLGSDIPFFLYTPAAYCTGRGEKIQPLNEIFPFSVLVIIPSISVATKSVYMNYRHDPTCYQTWADKINPLFYKKNIDSITKICANMLERSCFELHKELAEIKSRCEAFCGCKVCLSGSGCAMYILNPDRQQMPRLQSWLKDEFNCESRFVNNNRW
jgi:4-diphosphocytidyl-2-C-methyl-D-erythritol kinase